MYSISETTNRAIRRQDAKTARNPKYKAWKERMRIVKLERDERRRDEHRKMVDAQRWRGEQRRQIRATIGKKLGVNPRRVIVDHRTGEYTITD